MKFRQFEFRFFPRIRGKKKKKSKYSDTSLDKNFPVDKSFNYSKIGYDNAAVARTTAAAFDSGRDEYGHRFTYLRSNSDYSEYRNAPDYYSQTYSLPKLTIDIESLCSCDICSSSAENSAVAPIYCISSVLTPVGTPLCAHNSLPKTRTRIKTNPWLPSPSLSPAESILTSSSEFPFRTTTSDHYIAQRDILSNHSSAPVNHLGDELNNLSKVTEENIDDFERDNETKDDGQSLKARKRFSFTEFLSCDTDDSKCSSPVVEQIEIVGNISCKLCFKYEETVDDLLESEDVIPRDDTFLSIKDLLEDDYHKNDKTQVFGTDVIDQANDLTDADDNVGTEARATFNTSMDASMSTASELSDVISNMDLTFYDEGYMLESIDTGYGSGARESEDNSETGEFEPHDEPSFDEAELEWDNDPSAQSLQGLECSKTRTYSLSDTLDKPECRIRSRPRSRSLADIEASLDEKVSLLREEKYFVQRKIQEAKEEEKMRQKQVQIFRSYSVDSRKEVLLQTLNDLKTRLENQSSRLQASYDTVLSIQRTFSQRKSKLPVVETTL